MAFKLCTGCHKEVNVDPKQSHCGMCGAYLRPKRGKRLIEKLDGWLG